MNKRKKLEMLDVVNDFDALALTIQEQRDRIRDLEMQNRNLRFTVICSQGYWTKLGGNAEGLQEIVKEKTAEIKAIQEAEQQQKKGSNLVLPKEPGLILPTLSSCLCTGLYPFRSYHSDT